MKVLADLEFPNLVWRDEEMVVRVIKALDPEYCDIESLVFQPIATIVNLRVDDRVYTNRSLTGVIGGKGYLYCHSGNSIFRDTETVGVTDGLQSTNRGILNLNLPGDKLISPQQEHIHKTTPTNKISAPSKQAHDSPAAKTPKPSTPQSYKISLLVEKLKVTLPPNLNSPHLTETALTESLEYSVIMQVFGVPLLPPSLQEEFLGAAVRVDYGFEIKENGEKEGEGGEEVVGVVRGIDGEFWGWGDCSRSIVWFWVEIKEKEYD